MMAGRIHMNLSLISSIISWYQCQKNGISSKGMNSNNSEVMNDSNSKNMHGNNNRIMLCSAKEFLRENKHNGCCLDITPKKIQETKKMDFISVEIQ
jgi:hypothetical protein